MIVNNVSANGTGAQLDSIANLINGGGKQLLQLSSAKKFSTAGGISNSSSNQQQNGNLNGNDLENASAMLMMTTNLDSNSAANRANNPKSRGMQDYDQEMGEDGVGTSRKSNGDTDTDEDSIDADTEDALNEFAFLSNEKSSAEDGGSASDGGSSDDWDVDKTQLNELTEQYKKERKSMSNKTRQQSSTTTTQLSISSQRPNRSALQAMIANLAENSDEADASAASGEHMKANDQATGRAGVGAIPGMFLTENDQFGLDSSLGELSRISVNNPVTPTGVSDELVDVRVFIC